MNGRTQLLIGLAVVLLGAGIAALAFVDDEASVRTVEELLADPAAHTAGSRTLLAVPQPELVRPAGQDHFVANEGWSNVTVTTTAWPARPAPGEPRYFSTVTVSVATVDGAVRWSWSNETRLQPTDPTLAFPRQAGNWTMGTRAFALQAFDDGDGDTPRVWGVYDGPLKEPIQPKPSQFQGRLLARLPDGSPMPQGVLVYHVDEFTAGCSSKFLPPEEKARLEESGDL